MKKLLLIPVGLILAILTCSFFDKGIKGSGNVIEQQRTIKPFSKLEIQGVFNVYIIQSNQEIVKVETDDNLQEFIEVKNEGEKLIVKWKEDTNLKESTRMNVYITLKEIDRMKVEGVCNIQTNTSLKLKQLNLDYSGVGTTLLELNCDKFNAKVEAVGTLILKGRSDEAFIKSAGVGSVKAFDFIVNKLTVESEGVGNVEVNAEKEISISSSGIGSVKHRGHAVVKKEK